MREVINRLAAWDAEKRRRVEVPVGTAIRDYRIGRGILGDGGPEAYAMEFEFAGARLVCPLFLFQARTGTAEPPVLAAARQ